MNMNIDCNTQGPREAGEKARQRTGLSLLQDISAAKLSSGTTIPALYKGGLGHRGRAGGEVGVRST